MDSSCANSQQGVCTLIAGPAVRAYANEDSYIKEYSASVIKGPDTTSGGGCIGMWNYGSENPPGWQSPACGSLEIKSESKLLPPLRLQNAGGSTTNLLELRTGSGALAAAFGPSGQMTSIGGVAATGYGVAVEVYSAVPEPSNHSISPVTMLSPGADGTFSARFYLAQVDGGSGCGNAANISVELLYTDPAAGGGQPVRFTVPLDTSGRSERFTALALPGSPAGANVASGSVMFRARRGSNIQYSTTYTDGACAVQPKYQIVPVLEWY